MTRFISLLFNRFDLFDFLFILLFLFLLLYFDSFRFLFSFSLSSLPLSRAFDFSFSFLFSHFGSRAILAQAICSKSVLFRHKVSVRVFSLVFCSGQPWSHATQVMGSIGCAQWMRPDPSGPRPRAVQWQRASSQHRRQRQDVPQRPSGKEAGTAKPTVDNVPPLREASRPPEAVALNAVAEVQSAIAALGDRSPHVKPLKEHSKPRRPDPRCSYWRTRSSHARCSSHVPSVASRPKR